MPVHRKAKVPLGIDLSGLLDAPIVVSAARTCEEHGFWNCSWGGNVEADRVRFARLNRMENAVETLYHHNERHFSAMTFEQYQAGYCHGFESCDDPSHDGDCRPADGPISRDYPHETRVTALLDDLYARADLALLNTIPSTTTQSEELP